MKATEDHDDFPANLKQQRIRKASKYRLTNLRMYRWESLWETKDASCRQIYSPGELNAKARSSLFVPISSIKDVQARFRTELETQSRLAVTKKLSTERLPRDGRVRIGPVGGDATVELFPLGVG
jgi:hypothetical protein